MRRRRDRGRHAGRGGAGLGSRPLAAPLAVLAVVLIVLGGGAYAAYTWSQRQYFVGAHDGNVAIFQGVSQDLGPVKLSHVESESDVRVDDLPDFYRSKVEDRVSADTLRDAETLVGQLRTEALRCAATPVSCDGSGGIPTTTPSTTTSTTTGATSPTTTSSPSSTTTR